MKTKIYYEGNETALVQDIVAEESIMRETMPWRSVKKRGVIAIITEDPDKGWVVLSGYDYYIFKKGRWIGVDFFGLIEFLKDYDYIDYGVGWKHIHLSDGWRDADIFDVFAYIEEYCPVLFGRWTLHSEFDQILQEAENDREFGHKYGAHRDERKPQRFIPPE